MAKIDLTPPAAVAREAERGLKLREETGHGGTEVGVARAEQLRDRKALTSEDITSMSSYFARHEVDKQGKDWDNEEKPSAGKVAWLLWGGEPGREWADKMKAKLADED